MDRRAIIIVIDSVGIGELPDAAKYGDEGSNTLRHVYEANPGFTLSNLESMGLFHIENTGFIDKGQTMPLAAYGKMNEASAGKDTTTGHWEIAGIRTDKPFPLFPDGFQEEIISEFSRQTGRGVLCNKPASGTKVLMEYGEEQKRTGDFIVYTSGDSVFQIAAHTDVISLDELYCACEKARRILDRYSVGRVIARPFIGEGPDSYTRTSDRRDFSMPPGGKTVLEAIRENGQSVYAVGKIEDIFAGVGITDAVHIENNADGVKKTIDAMAVVQSGVIFTNLVDFDSLYGHRNDPAGYAGALAEFDNLLPSIKQAMTRNDILIITADHGCDPTTESTDHSREYVPLFVFGEAVTPVNLGIRETFSDVAATVAEYLNISYACEGVSFLPLVLAQPDKSE